MDQSQTLHISDILIFSNHPCYCRLDLVWNREFSFLLCLCGIRVTFTYLYMIKFFLFAFVFVLSFLGFVWGSLPFAHSFWNRSLHLFPIPFRQLLAIGNWKCDLIPVFCFYGHHICLGHYSEPFLISIGCCYFRQEYLDRPSAH